MCNFSPSPQFTPPPIDAKTAAALDDLRRGIARKMGWDEEKTELVICRPNPIEDNQDDDS